MYATDCYRSLFGAVHLLPVSLSEGLPVCLEKNDRLKLVEPFSSDELKLAVFEMEHNMACGLDGVPAVFFQSYFGCY